MKFLMVVFLIICLMINGCKPLTSEINSSKLYSTQTFGFSQAVMANGLLITSGQVGWNKDRKLTGSGDFEDQLDQSLRNIELLLSETNGSWADVLHLRVYVVDLDSQKRKLVGSRIQKIFNNRHKPATTLLGIQSLARKELLVEIEAMAFIN